MVVSRSDAPREQHKSTSYRVLFSWYPKPDVKKSTHRYSCFAGPACRGISEAWGELEGLSPSLSSH